MQSEMTFIPEESDADVKVYRVKISHYSRGNYLYGVLCIPNKEGRFPAVLRLPGAGVAKHTGDKELARMGVITFRIGIHGIPLDLKPEAYANLQAGALKNYMYHHMDNGRSIITTVCSLVVYGRTISLPHFHNMMVRIWRLMVEAREEH